MEEMAFQQRPNNVKLLFSHLENRGRVPLWRKASTKALKWKSGRLFQRTARRLDGTSRRGVEGELK